MKLEIRKIAAAAIIGALYAVLTALLAPISYGPLQLRVSEALCILPFFLPFTAWGLFFGCAIANIVGAAGILDILFGSLATLCAGLCTAAVGKRGEGLRREFLACAMPVLWNSLIIGAVMTFTLTDRSPSSDPGAFALFAAQIGLGELGVMYLIALPLMRWLPKRKFFLEIVHKFS